MFRSIYFLFFKRMGWEIEGAFPTQLKKYIVAIAPHTSNWDFVIGIVARSILRMQHIKFLGKSQLFKIPFGWLFKMLGGYPVDRSSSHDVVQHVVDLFRKHDQFILAIAPEGTRKKVTKLKTGFYYIAKQAGIPIVPCGFDFSKKKVIIGSILYPTDSIDQDMKLLTDFYKAITGRNPSLGIQ